MSAHFVDRKGPPPGLSSFTKIRLGWISSEQVVRVNPGETQRVVLAPLAGKGGILAVKVPLEGGRYYLVENRQPIHYDKVLPDCGMLVIQVDPDAEEGSGTAKIMDADPSTPYLQHATYRPELKNRSTFIDKTHGVAIVALGYEGKNLSVLITSPEKIGMN